MPTSKKPPAVCKAVPTPSDPICNFHARAGQLTLRVTGQQGIIEFQTAQYNGTPIVGTPSGTIAFIVAAGQHNLDVVYAFSDTVNGRGELREVCKDNVLLDPDVSFTNPAVRYVICV
jgi:hypothetical protein